MSKERKKIQKKKDRERQVRKKILAIREDLRQPERDENADRKRVKRIVKLQKSLGDLNEWSDSVFAKMNDDTLSQLERNCKILKALEKEYSEERSRKDQLNKDLEEQGFETLDQKINFLHQKLVDQAKAAQDMSVLGDLGLQNPKINVKEVAEVEVVKANIS